MFQTRQLSEALLAVAGVWLLIRQMPDYATSLYMGWSDPSLAHAPDAPNFLVIQGFHFFVSALLGSVLILGRKPISKWVTPNRPEHDSTAGVLISIGAAVIGIFYLAAGVITLGTYYAIYEKLGSTSPNMFWRGFFSVGVGIFLFAVSVGLGRLWLLLRGRIDLRA